MNGAELLIRTAVAGGIDICFANPGTTETPLVMAFDKVPGIKAILGLFEGACTGAADGYGRMKGKPAMTLLHLGPGLANGIANLHNARRAGTPMVNLIGEHTTWHSEADPPLAMDIEALAGTVSGWLHRNSSARELSQDMAEAISASSYGQISSLIVAHDHQSEGLHDDTIHLPTVSFDPPETILIEEAASLLRKSSKSALMLGSRALVEPALSIAGRITALTGADLLTGSFPSRMELGLGLPRVGRLPYFPEPALAFLSQYESIILAGMKEPVTFFGYKGIDSYLIRKDQAKVSICGARQDVVKSLQNLLHLLGNDATCAGTKQFHSELNRPGLPAGDLTPEKACACLAAMQPEGSIIVDEGLTSATTYHPYGPALPYHTVLALSGGAIGFGIPCATGAALACPDRPVINLQADGSGLYTLQTLWTQAREGLNVTTLICSNRKYNIVRVEFARAGIASPGPFAQALTDLGHPSIDWAKIAHGFGVPAVSVETAEGLVHELGLALAEPGPHLIEMVW